MRNRNYPALFQSTDRLANESQSKYLNYVKSYIFLLILLSGVSSFNIYFRYKDSIIVVLLILIIYSALMLMLKNHHNTWYNARAVAESVKTISWRYMMKAAPYTKEESKKNRQQFTKEIRRILRQNQEISSQMTGKHANKDNITDKMEEIRKLSVDKRLDFYLEERIKDQRDWYSNKAKTNAYKGRKWFGSVIILLSIALLIQLFKVDYINQLSSLSLVTTLATGGLTWIQTKKFRELSAAYTLTSHEIGLIESLSNHVNSEEDIDHFVIDSENAFSREHTQWAARRD